METVIGADEVGWGSIAGPGPVICSHGSREVCVWLRRENVYLPWGSSAFHRRPSRSRRTQRSIRENRVCGDASKAIQGGQTCVRRGTHPHPYTWVEAHGSFTPEDVRHPALPRPQASHPSTWRVSEVSRAYVRSNLLRERISRRRHEILFAAVPRTELGGGEKPFLRAHAHQGDEGYNSGIHGSPAREGTRLANEARAHATQRVGGARLVLRTRTRTRESILRGRLRPASQSCHLRGRLLLARLRETLPQSEASSLGQRAHPVPYEMRVPRDRALGTRCSRKRSEGFGSRNRSTGASV